MFMFYIEHDPLGQCPLFLGPFLLQLVPFIFLKTFLFKFFYLLGKNI